MMSRSTQFQVLFLDGTISAYLYAIKAFILCFSNFKKLCPVWPGESIKNCKKQIEGGTVIFNETWFGMFEVILEPALQFIIQLHAAIVQQEQDSTIQIMTRNFLSAHFLKWLNWKTGHALCLQVYHGISLIQFTSRAFTSEFVEVLFSRNNDMIMEYASPHFNMVDSLITSEKSFLV